MSYLRNHEVQFEPIEQWPGDETAERKRSRFDSPYSATLRLLDHELWELDADNVVVQMDLPRTKIRRDGAPRSDARPDSPRVILSFDSKHGPLSYPCDTFLAWQDNLRAIALGLEALRKVDRYGVSNTGQQYRGWQPLPPPASDGFSTREAAWGFICQVVGLPANTPLNGSKEEVIRKAQFATHPDRGGDGDRFKRVMAAVEALNK